MEKDISIGLCSSGSRLIVAIEHDGQIKSMRRKLFSQETALFPTLEKLLPPGKDLSSIKEVCALKGPGRFTGIRIALTVAGIMNALSGAEAHSATVFETLACQASESKAFHKHFPSGGKIAVLMQAFREEYFCAIYYAAVPGSLPEKNMEPVWFQRPEMEKLLRGIKEPFFCIADEEEKPGIYDLIPANAIRAAKNISKILPEYLIKAPRLYGGADLKPLYLKPAKFELDAMEKAAREKVSLK